MTEPVFTVANQLTMLRMALVPRFVLLALGREFTWALVVFVVAGLTDALDGYVARHARPEHAARGDARPDRRQAADGVDLRGADLEQRGRSCAMPVWLTVTLLFRDAMLVVGVVVVNLTVGPREFSPSRLGKVSTALNMVTGAAVLAVNAAGRVPAGAALALRSDPRRCSWPRPPSTSTWRARRPPRRTERALGRLRAPSLRRK